jgi:hypothetical protein
MKQLWFKNISSVSQTLLLFGLPMLCPMAKFQAASLNEVFDDKK